MFAGFKYESLPLKDIALDERNPRIVSQTPLKTQAEILSYLYENEELEGFIKKIASEGKNLGAERPYVIKKGAGYIVIEGNTRIAAYKVLTGILKSPKEYAATVPHISDAAKSKLLVVDCSIAPSRDALMPIMILSPLRYPGGKAKLFPYFAELIRCNKLFSSSYCEPYAGGAGLAIKLLTNGFVERISINDIDQSIYAFWMSRYETRTLHSHQSHIS